MAQVQTILEPVFARLGVKHEARNLANGGLGKCSFLAPRNYQILLISTYVVFLLFRLSFPFAGTLQHGLASASIYGPDVDILMWDAGRFLNELAYRLVYFLCA